MMEEKKMTSVKVKLMEINDVKDFVAAASLCAYDVDLVSGRYTVDAKSLMGIFSIVPSDSLECNIYSDNCDEFLSDIKKFIVE